MSQQTTLAATPKRDAEAVATTEARARPGVVVAGLVLVGLLLPPRAVAVALAGAGAGHLESVVAGAWLFKGLLLLNGVLIWLCLSRLPRSGELRATASGAAPLAHVAVVAGLVGAGLAVRLVHLGDGLWLDEIWTLLDYANRPFGEILTLYDSQNQHPLYSLGAHASLLTFGEGAWALRLPAVLLGVASLPALYWFGARLVPRREALFATALLTLSYHHVWFSQNARGYTALLLLTLLSTAFLHRLLTDPGAARAPLVLGYAACMALACYAHLSAALVVIGHLVVAGVLLVRSGRAEALRVVPALAAVVLAGTLSLQLYGFVLPQLPATLLHGSEVGETVWRQPLWMLAEAVRGLSQGVPGGWVAVLLAGSVAAFGLASLWRRNPVAVGLMIAPPAITGITMTALGHNLWPRFFFFAAGFALLIAVRGVSAAAELLVPRRAVAVSSAVLLVVILGSAAMVPRAWGPKQDYQGARDYVERARSADDAVVALGLTELPFVRQMGTGWSTVADVHELQRIEAERPRTWAFYTFAPHLESTQPEVWDRLTREYRLAAEFPGTLSGGTVYLMVKE